MVKKCFVLSTFKVKDVHIVIGRQSKMVKILSMQFLNGPFRKSCSSNELLCVEGQSPISWTARTQQRRNQMFVRSLFTYQFRNSGLSTKLKNLVLGWRIWLNLIFSILTKCNNIMTTSLFLSYPFESVSYWPHE